MKGFVNATANPKTVEVEVPSNKGTSLQELINAALREWPHSTPMVIGVTVSPSPTGHKITLTQWGHSAFLQND